MTWNSRANGGRITQFGAPTACGGGQPVGLPVPATEIVTNGLSTYFLKAHDPADQLAWRKYDPGATVLRVTHNLTPNAPDHLTTDRTLPPPCRWCGATPYIGDDNIRLIARLSDPDGELVHPMWRTNIGGVESAWNGSYQPSGASHDANISLKDADGKAVTWWVHASDGTVGSAHTVGTTFRVDRKGITQAPSVSSAEYPQDNRWHGGVGVQGTFRFDRGAPCQTPDTAGVCDIDHYLYHWRDGPSTKVDAQALGGPASVALHPPADGPNDLYVQSVDRAGHRSPMSVYHFYVRAGNGPLAQWSLDGNAHDSAFLGDRHGSLHGGATYTAQGALGSAVQLDGIDDHVSAPNAIRNDVGFTVSAWVNLTSAAGVGTVLSQDGTMFPGYALWYRVGSDGTNPRWSFGVPNSTSADKGAPIVSSPAGMPQLNTWTHLAGVYDPVAKQIRLYVSGKEVGVLPHTVKPDVAAGPVRIGRTMWAGNAAVDHWAGAIDEVLVHDRVLSDTEISSMVSTSNVQAAHWKFDEEAGTTARNSVEGGPDGVLENGAAFTTEGAVAGGVRLDGENDVVSTPGLVVRTDQSFSVAAQVKLDRFDTGSYTVISQAGERICGFCLQYQNGRWLFVFPGSDVDSPTDYYYVATPATAKPDGWTHLVGTYDAATKKIRLYVDGAPAGEATRTTVWEAERALDIGRALVEGEHTQHLPGTVDEVRVYNRAISQDEVSGIVSRDNVTAGTWKLDSTAQDANGRLADGTLKGGPDWTAGQTGIPDPNDFALRLNGTGAHVDLPNVIDTDRSFSVAAWARLDRLGGDATVMSQDGGTVSGFMLKALPDGRWSFFTPTSDAAVTGDSVAGGSAQAGTWTHLVGVYSRDRQRIELYINGVLAASAPHTAGFDADGGFQIGRSKRNGVATDYFSGAIDDVTVYSRALVTGEIQTMSGRDLSLGHNWTIDEGRGTTTGDAVGARTATLANGTTFGPGRVGNAARFDGVDDVVSTTGVDVRTDASFTVSAWAYLEGNDCDLTTTTRCVVSAVSLEGGGAAPAGKFRLGHVVDRGQNSAGKWVFEMPELDGTVSDAAVDVRPGQLNTWVHLVGVYDASARVIWLYVNGSEKDEGTLLSAWQATGPLRIGHGRTGDAPGWRGAVDDVRMYSGALTDDRITALYKAYPAPAGANTLPVANAGWWKFDENTGTTATDSSGRGQTATMRGGAGWNAGRSGHTGWFDGTTGHAETAGKVVDTDGSFSVAAWAYLTDGGHHAAVVGQDGSRSNAFLLQYDLGSKKWAAIAVQQPNADNSSKVYALSAEPAALHAWTHLALVYHAGHGQLRLYVNGALSSVQVGVTMEASAGPLVAGRCKWNGTHGCYFPGGIDDVRAYNGKPLTDGEVRRIHDDVPPASFGFWRFDDGTARDHSWRQNPTTLSGGTSFTQGLLGGALQLDGVSGAATAKNVGVPMRDSFTVAAWARLSRGDKAATVIGQDGDRRSAFALQYRPEVNRWMFGAATHDADSVPLVYASSLQPPKLGTWTHLTGVYDYPARQLRLYVNGEHVGTRDNVLLWATAGGFTIGRGKDKGAPAEFFPGAIDDVTTDLGVVPDTEIRARAGRPAPSGGQLGRFINESGEHYSAYATTGALDQFGPVPAGYRFEGPLGMMLTAEQPGTRRLYACLAGTDEFTSSDPACEGQSKIADLGWVYVSPPEGRATVPLHRCLVQGEHFDSNNADCGGYTVDVTLGHLLAYAPLTRYFHPRVAEHTATASATPPGYRRELALGLVAMTAEPGTRQLVSCVDGVDQFLSLDPACEGKTVQGKAGWLWSQPPPGQASRPLFQCVVTAGPMAGQQFTSIAPDCEEQTVRGPLGHVLVTSPGPTA
jgi:hypothetical protein